MRLSRRTRFLSALLTLQQLFSSSAVASQEQAREPLGTLRTTGEVYVGSARVPGEATLFVGDTVRTGADGAASLAVPARGTFIIARETDVSFPARGRYFASLRQGSIGLRSLMGARGFQIQVGSFAVFPVVEVEAVAEIERGADGSVRVSCSLGSVGVIALEGPESVFLRPGQIVTISAEGVLQTAAAPAPTQPPLAPSAKKKSRAGYVALGVVAAGAAGAAAALVARGGKERVPVSPSRP